MTVTVRRPLIRSSQVRSNLAAVRGLPEAQVDGIHRALGPEFIASIHGDVVPTWISLDVDRQLFSAIHAIAGDEGVRECGRAAMLEVAGLPSFRPLVQATVRVFGLTPGNLLRLAPKGWEHSVRNAGALEYLGGARDQPQIRYVDVPNAILDDAIYIDSIAASFEAAIWYAGLRGDVRWHRVGDGLEFTAGWIEARSSGTSGP